MDQRALPDLLPCPCCGGRAVMIWPYATDDDDGEARVECSDCALRLGFFPTAQDAKEAWNLRTAPKTPETHITAELEKLQTDALRYRWLREPRAISDGVPFAMSLSDHCGSLQQSGVALDIAIDEAMSSEPRRPE